MAAHQVGWPVVPKLVALRSVCRVPVEELMIAPVTVLSAKFAVYRYWFEGSSTMQRGEDPEPKGTVVVIWVRKPVVGSMKKALTELASLLGVRFGPIFAR